MRRPPGAAGHLHGRHRGHVLRHADRAVPGLRRRVRRGRGAGAAVCGAGGGVAGATLTSGWTGTSTATGRHLLRRRRLGRRLVLRPGARPGAGAGRPGGGRRRRHAAGIFRGTVWNQTIPDQLRGRLAGIEQVSYSTGPLLGNVESGVAASLGGRARSIVSGGVLCVAGVAVVALALPAFWRYDARADGARLGFAGDAPAPYFTQPPEGLELLVQ